MNIMLIDEDGKKVSDSIDFIEATKIADKCGKNLMLVNKQNKVYRIADEGRLKYEQRQKRKKQKAHKRAHKIKEIQLRPTIDDGDLNTKIRHMNEFLKNGLRTKLIMKFRRYQMAFKDSGMHKVNTIVNKLVESNIATIDGPPRFEGNNIVVFLNPKK